MDHQSYEGGMEQRLGELGREIDSLSHRAELTARDAKQNAAENLQALRGQRDALADNLERMRHATGKAWDELQTGMESTWNDVQKTLRKASSRFQ